MTIHFTLHPLVAELFIATPNQFLLEAFSSISATLQLLREDFSLPYPPLSIARYSFIQLSELRQCGVKQIPQTSEHQ